LSKESDDPAFAIGVARGTAALGGLVHPARMMIAKQNADFVITLFPLS
jgi:hypothetical protein